MGGPDVSGLRQTDDAPPQFGARDPGADYPERRGAHGVALNDQGQIALARIGRNGAPPEFDLPGGGVDAGESDEAALIREFMEETGLPVQPGRLIARAKQYWRTDKDETRNADFMIFEAFVSGPLAQPTEPDHTLVWKTPAEAITLVRHEAHAFALKTFLARRGL